MSNTIEMTNDISTGISQCTTSSFAMPVAMPTTGHLATFGEVTQVPATGLTSRETARDLRDRKATAFKGHVAFVAYIPGIHAWSPPIC